MANPAPGVAGTDLHRGAQVGEAATEGGSQPEKHAPQRKRRAPKNRSRKRAPKSHAAKRVHVCSVRLNDDEKSVLSAAAAATRISLPAFLARSGLAAARDLDKTAAAIAGEREVTTELFAARRHLGQVGNNLNQIARQINSGGRPSETDVVIAAVHRAVSRVQAATDQMLSRR
ncbi:plasmid mobilization protein [Streptomyces acidiscabies]|uniref:Plasmid mobilization relaxosome protein MobC n=1 Tax=Streptomyces acidiscabies TaxID=42234 RepID=A0AAP6EIX9_9ACTN|nr:plasmid mobilization relaxosome protein MobC [Streptomyces acidiscabies]MDX2964368.1 plasmid mobilization relaxosome protein MobC [Streptomyces acidiscabies]MDX3024903.1 plasmid mobilization relaxosome protein MobC [Streptomyces acidiscabies]MDX3794191.1 plasmid mobilization relaxosome protein MobC [Streptomyces acidiscabies]